VRITHVITRLILGGAQENTLASAIGLARRPGFQVRLISGPSHGPEGSLETLAGQHPGLLVPLRCLVRPLHPWNDMRAWMGLTRWFREHQPDLVHTHSGKAGFLGRLAARRARVPHIVHTIHGPSFGPFQGPLANQIFRAAERWAGRFTHHFVVVAHAMRDRYLAAGIGQPNQYSRILSGFALDPFLRAQPDAELRHQLGIEPGDLVLGMVARLFRLKGHDDLLDAAPELIRRQPRFRFLLVGDGAWRTRLEEKARRLGVHSRVTFTGLIPPEEIPRHLALVDVLVHLSRREGLARVLPQALATAIPVVASDCDGAAEVCIEDVTGFLIRPGDRAMLIDRVCRLAADPGLRRRLGGQGRDMVRSLFPVERMVEELARLYESLARSGPDLAGSGTHSSS
jgi:glycosyltransferase involved in cell wall biosynthesis